jgi:outer membrane protein assembly factor BamB
MTGFAFRRSLYALSLLAALTALSATAETVTSDWSYTIPTGGSRGAAIDGAGNIYTVGETGSTSYLYSISPAGVNNWSVTLGSFNNAKGPTLDLDRGVLYVAAGNGYNGTGFLKAYDFNGNSLWDYNTGGIASNPAIDRDGTIYVGDFTAGNVFAINPDGTLKWIYTLPSNIHMSAAGATVLEDGRIAIPTLADNFPTQTAAVYLFNADGTLAWAHSIDGRFVTGIAADAAGNLVVSEDANLGPANVYGIGIDGTRLWTFAAGNNNYGPALAVDGSIYIGSFDGKLYAFNADGSPQWEYDTGLLLGAPTAGENGTIYVASRSGSGDQLFAISATGSLLAQAALTSGYGGAWELSAPALTGNGKLYLGHRSNQLQAFSVSAQGLADSPWPRTYQNNQNTAQVPTTTIAYWTFDEGSGSTATDISGNGHDATLFGAQWTTGQFNSALGVTASPGTYASASSSADFSFTTSESFTIEAWVKANASYGGDVYGLVVGSATNIANTWSLNSKGTGFTFRLNGGHGRISTLHTPLTAHNERWVHVAAVYDASTTLFRIYVNGIASQVTADASLAGQLTDDDTAVLIPASIPFGSIGDLLFGKAENLSNHYFSGTLDEVRISSAALMPDQFIGHPFVEVSIPDLTSFYAQPLSAPVQLSDIDGQGIVAAEIFVAFDSDLLTPSSSPVSSTTMTSAWTIETNVVEGSGTPIDTLKIAMADEVALTGAGDLLTLHFDVADIRVPYTSPLALVHVLFNDGTPPATSVDGSVKLIGTTATTGFLPLLGAIPRETLTLSVNDADENTDPSSAQQVSVSIVNGAQTETLVLNEQGIDTDLFSNQINTVFSLVSTSATTSGDGIVQAKAGDVITFYFVDQLTGSGDGPVQLQQPIPVFGGSDGSIETTVVAQPGDTVRVKVVDADMSGSVNVRVDNPRSGDLEWLVLPEFSPGSSIFYGRFFTDEGTGVSGDSTLSILDCDTLLISYYDDVTALGDSTTLINQTNGVVPFGDADDNGNVQAFDAALVLLHVLSPHLTLWDSLSVNVDLQAPFGPITPYDASLILQSRVGLIGRFPVQTPLADNQPQPETSLQPGPKLVPETRWLSLRAGAGYLSVWAEDRADILSGDMLITGIEGKVQAGKELGGFLVESRATEDGLRVVFAGAEAISGSGELLRVYGASSEGAQLASASFNDGSITAQLESGPISATPATYALHANVPNPFNPETVIAFDLAQDSPVQLVVYDVLGQQVRSLVAGFLPAGAQRVLWDGRNQRGAQVGSGVYFYRLEAGEFVQTRRMMLLK